MKTLIVVIRRSDPLRGGVGDQCGDQERDGRVVRARGDEGEGGEEAHLYFVVKYKWDDF